MRSGLVVLLALMLGSKTFFAQVDQVYTGTPSQSDLHKRPFNNSAWKEDVVWGGNFQIWFGNPTFILLSPTIGYSLSEKLQIGVGGIYNYTSYQGYYGTYSQSVFGMHTYGRYLLTESFYLQAQFDRLNQPDLYAIDPNSKRWVNYLFAGIGFRHAFSEKAAFTTSILYNLTPDILSIYPSRVLVQFGVVAGL